MIQIPEIDGPAPLSAEALVAGARLGYYSNLIVGFTPPGCLALMVGGTFVGLYLSLVWAILWADWVAENPRGLTG